MLNDQRDAPSRAARAVTTALISLTAIAAAALPATAHAEPRPAHAPAAAADSSGTLLDTCPVEGSATFEDSWGWARSGGRRHEGVDIIADRGTPIVAVRDGYAHFKTNGLGGRAIWLTAENGDRFYYAHLDDWEGESREVTAGEVIGSVGSTGNARGPHLHFETLPDGNVENPYPHTFGSCVPTPSELAAARNRLNDPTLWTRFVPTL